MIWIYIKKEQVYSIISLHLLPINYLIVTMQLLGITFILYLLKLSADNGFWKPLSIASNRGRTPRTTAVHVADVKVFSYSLYM